MGIRRRAFTSVQLPVSASGKQSTMVRRTPMKVLRAASTQARFWFAPANSSANRKSANSRISASWSAAWRISLMMLGTNRLAFETAAGSWVMTLLFGLIKRSRKERLISKKTPFMEGSAFNSSAAAGSVKEEVLPVPTVPKVRQLTPFRTGSSTAVPLERVAGMPPMPLGQLGGAVFCIAEGSS